MYRVLKSQIVDFTSFPMLMTEVDEDGTLSSQPVPKTVTNVKALFDTILLENGWNGDDIKKVAIVTDEASNLSFGLFLLLFKNE